MTFQLTAGAIPRCFDDTGPEFQPTLQVIGFREVKGKSGAQKRFRLIVSDGAHFSVGMLTTQLKRRLVVDLVHVAAGARLGQRAAEAALAVLAAERERDEQRCHRRAARDTKIARRSP